MNTSKPVIICIYSKECKFCQIANEFLEYLSITDKIIYLRYNMNKIIKEFFKIININELTNINIVFPYFYLINHDNEFIPLNVTEILKDSIKYKNSLINKPTQKHIFDNIMLNK
ncbi:hypothetical protein [Alphaentomopoxvirus acuprea]|uniref:Thioredoxin n=1 Tax=Alphaentomopoxvirus acuprea TaxID=62099 RepID=W6JPL2_9POXV|nr:hypothetical protein BA82_gp114 [Anomala cuprea entomopoxvirus]BAO49474.1 hypothetical protein [Anomala cuprea entomopoxvirus]